MAAVAAVLGDGLFIPFRRNAIRSEQASGNRVGGAVEECPSMTRDPATTGCRGGSRDKPLRP